MSPFLISEWSLFHLNSSELIWTVCVQCGVCVCVSECVVCCVESVGRQLFGLFLISLSLSLLLLMSPQALCN